jgi:hypothetical protein
MSFGVGTAAPDSLSLAVALHQAPARFPELLRGHGHLPSGVTILLRLAGGASLDDEEFVSPPLLSVPELRNAARFFVEQVLLSRDADHYRVLGVSHDAAIEEIKEHHRLLMRIFHPDRTDPESNADAAIAARINLAYNALRLPADRAAYDAKLRQAPKAGTVVHAPMGAARPDDAEPPKPVLSPFVARHLPQFVLAGVAVVAALGVGIVYVTREPTGAIGAGQGRLEPLTSSMRVAMRDQATAQQSPPQPAAPAKPGTAATPDAVPQPNTQAPSSDHTSRRMTIDAEPTSVRPPRPVGVTREIAPVPSKPVVDRSPARDSREAAKPRAESPEPAAKPVTPKPALQIATDLGAERAAPSVAAPAPATPSTPETIAANLQPATVEPAPVQRPPQAPAATVQMASTERPPVQPVAQAAHAQPAVVAAAVPQPAPPPPPAPRQVGQADLASLVSQLSATYGKGDIESFLALFSQDARDEVGGKDHIRSDYTNLFQSTAARQLYVWDMTWRSEGGVYRGEGNYQAKVVRKGEDQAHVYEGKLKLEVVQVNGAPRVRAMYH